MAKKKVQELRELPIQELEDKVISMKADLAKEKAQISSGTRAENPGKIKKIRRDIARTLTIINEKKTLGKIKLKKEEKDKKEHKKKHLEKVSSKEEEKEKIPAKKIKQKKKVKKKAKKKIKNKKEKKMSKKKQKKHLRKSKKKKGKKGGNKKNE